jgi:acetate kinase
VPQVACFDTSFHPGHPAVAELIPLPRDICKSDLQRYGFHGLSYEYIASVLPQQAPELAGRRVIVAHLSGAAQSGLGLGDSDKRGAHGRPAHRLNAPFDLRLL